MALPTAAPFPEEDGIFTKLIDQFVPSESMHSVDDEFSCPVLDALHPHLDLISRKSSSHIDPLHVHLRKRRTIQITEDVGLHLVWDSSTIYIKPIPSYLLSFEFWNCQLSPDRMSRPQALGFMRTYSHLIRHRSDFHIAQKEDLIPPSKILLYGDFEKFIRNFRTIADSEVSPRWEFGQLRLGWLNWAVRVFQPKVIESRGGMFRRLFYEGRYHQTRQFVREFGTPLLFIFATLSLILSAMQVVLAARPNNSWPGFVSVSVWFSIAVIIILSAIFFFILLVIVVVLIIQLGFAFRARRRQITERVA